MSQDPEMSRPGEPIWEIVTLYPNQGSWNESDYLAFDASRLVEFDNGMVEFIEMQTELHQAIVLYLYLQLHQFSVSLSEHSGVCLVAPLKVRLWEGKYREPDLVFLLSKNRHLRSSQVWNGADLVIEVVSESNPDRDWIDKRSDYAKGGIPEYWIVDPRDRTITVLQLDDTTGIYESVQTFREGEQTVSKLLPGFRVDVSATFDRPELA